MSSLPNAKPLPPAWVERLFDRFKVAFGVQKVGAMWQGMEPAEVMAGWGAQLGRFPPDALARALQAVIDSGREWPPTLPEFVAICRDFHRPRQDEGALSLPAPGQGHTDREAARAQLERIRAMMASAVKPMQHVMSNGDDE